MGVAVFAGMLGVTFFGLFLTPVFYVLLRSLAMRFGKPAVHGAKLEPHTPELEGALK
jgi:multidrug efflux pump